MPGIFGVVDTSLIKAERPDQAIVELVRQMAAAMLYESFYSVHLVSCPGLGACVGQVQLKDSADQGTTLGHGYPFALTTGEAVPQTPAIDEEGDETVRRIEGRCAGFVADQRASKCFLFNDRYGRERLFLHADGTRTFFSSEAKAILAVAPTTRAFDPIGLAEFVASGCTLGSRSLFRDIEVLEPGMVVTFERAGVRRRRFFNAEDLEELGLVEGTQFLEGFAESLRAAVDRSVKGSPAVAVSLTGGLDSRMIMASLDRRPGSVPCYTFGSMYRTTSDVAVAREVATRCGQPHRVIELGSEFLADFREHFRQSVYVSDGYLGLSGAAELYVNRQARSVAPARMTGNWGGELTRGVHAFKFRLPKGGFVNPELVQCMRESASAFSSATTHPVSRALFHQIPLQGYGRYAIERSQVVTRTPFLADEVIQWLYRAPSDVRGSMDTTAAVIGHRPELLAIPTDAGALGVRRSGMRRLWRRAVTKAEYVTSHGAPDWVARLGSRLPPSLLDTRFLGVDKFYHFRYWMRRDLAGYVRDTLVRDSSVDLREWFDLSAVAMMVEDHIAGRANHTDAIDKLLTAAIARTTFSKAVPAYTLPVIVNADVWVCDRITR
jgi:asparagine synthase (glutamine-hydrolysing)